MQELTEQLKTFRKDNDLDQKEMALYVGIGYRTYQTIEASGDVKKVGDLNKIKTKISTEQDEKTKLIAEIKKQATKLKPEKTKSKIEDDDMPMKALLNLTESNKSLSDSNNKLTNMLEEKNKKATEDADTDIPVAYASRFSDLLELIAELASDQLKYKSKQEAVAALSKRFFGMKEKSEGAGIRNSSGTVGK